MPASSCCSRITLATRLFYGKPCAPLVRMSRAKNPKRRRRKARKEEQARTQRKLNWICSGQPRTRSVDRSRSHLPSILALLCALSFALLCALRIQAFWLGVGRARRPEPCYHDSLTGRSMNRQTDMNDTPAPRGPQQELDPQTIAERVGAG